MPNRINNNQRKLICVSRTIDDLSVLNKPLINTCQYCSTSRANQALRSLANAGFQNRGVCLQAFPSFPSPSPLFHFLALVSFLTRSKPKIPFLGLFLLQNLTETLATQASGGYNHPAVVVQPFFLLVIGGSVTEQEWIIIIKYL